MENPTTTVLSFYELSVDQLYDILALRFHVFVEEQQSIYNELDGVDKLSTHVLMIENHNIIGYARVYKKSNTVASFGRVCIAKEYRKKNLGKQLVKQVIHVAKHMKETTSLEIEAQEYLKTFYEGFGFKQTSQPYDDGGVMHIDMKLDC